MGQLGQSKQVQVGVPVSNLLPVNPRVEFAAACVTGRAAPQAGARCSGQMPAPTCSEGRCGLFVRSSNLLFSCPGSGSRPGCLLQAGAPHILLTRVYSVPSFPEALPDVPSHSPRVRQMVREDRRSARLLRAMGRPPSRIEGGLPIRRRAARHHSNTKPKPSATGGSG